MDLLATARAVLATGPVCDVCLGRIFADRSFGLTNRERGRAVRTAVALADDNPYEPPTECWVCNGRADTYDQWADRVLDELAPYDFETYQIGTRPPPLIEENDRLLRVDAGLEPESGESFKTDFNREVGKRVGAKSGATVDFERPDVLAVLDLDAEYIDLQINAAFVYGRYQKHERGIPQTEWPCRECNGAGTVYVDGTQRSCEHCEGTGHLYETSVEEELVPTVVEAMDGIDGVFHGAGREDVDARMLGTGRPFVIEVTRPQVRRPDLDTLGARFNDTATGVEVTDLALARYDMVERVKELAADKTYRATVRFEEPVSSEQFTAAVSELNGATIEQETPQRVDHRRAHRVRTRTIRTLSGTLTDEQTATLEITGEGGLYIKELVSGDDGRTKPSLAGLLECDAQVTALDVVAVTGETESFADEAYLLE